ENLLTLGCVVSGARVLCPYVLIRNVLGVLGVCRVRLLLKLRIKGGRLLLVRRVELLHGVLCLGNRVRLLVLLTLELTSELTFLGQSGHSRLICRSLLV